MICFDSDFIIDFLRGKADAIDKMKSLEQSATQIVTTAINSLEVFVGIVSLDSATSQRVILTRNFLDSLVVLPFDHIASLKAATLLNFLKRKGTLIGLKDTLIAAIAIMNNVPLLTRNVKHFEKIPDLVLETW